ncbi:DUF5828 family protein [Salarchaeum sp. JOR-1]|uniref:DUF5828 family protein n=1 Tax=Salarchaeum sp. JOR-1 TaxID=2599399 RepID=UPI001198BA35|nr:DUF5828 family protein [Salarchaeum sp. JOR-1]QDX40304.1 hypothetical protein FQU85_05110 [Salarchaeum sp. JOR-1]
MEESISGFKVRGDWGEIVEHGERVTYALREAGVDSDALAAWDEWRPKAHERIDEEVSEKTAEQASVREGEGERAGRSADDDLGSAGDRLTESYEKLGEDDVDGAVSKWQDSIDYVARAADTAGRKALRTIENTVYRKVMTQIAPYYFDNDLVSANVRYVRSQEEFVFEVNVNDDDLKDAVREYLESYKEDVERWHVDAEKDVESVAAAEGVELPETDADTNPTTN